MSDGAASGCPDQHGASKDGKRAGAGVCGLLLAGFQSILLQHSRDFVRLKDREVTDAPREWLQIFRQQYFDPHFFLGGERLTLVGAGAQDAQGAAHGVPRVLGDDRVDALIT